MKNYPNSLPTFGKYASLLNEIVRPDLADMNEWHFQCFFKQCLIHSGFISYIRYNQDDTLYLKLYFFDNKVKF